MHKKFIGLGWYTVPLKGTLDRLPDGKKTIPKFYQDWKQTHTDKFNKEPSEIAGVLTGEKSGIIAIDCDTQYTYDIFKSLDPTYNWHFISLGKKQGGGTIIYKYHPKIPTFQLQLKDGIKLDYFSDGGFIYLPTEGNKTKVEWKELPDQPLKDIPETILTLLDALSQKTVIQVETKDTKQLNSVKHRLAPLVEDFISKKQYLPSLFRIITPKSFRETREYLEHGHLHPKYIPDGRGSEYISKVSAILGSDISISVELYLQAMGKINQLWEQPIEKKILKNTITDPMINKKASIGGSNIWQYDPHWKDIGFFITSSNGDYVESFYDDIKGIYYIINHSLPTVKTYTNKTQAINTLKSLMGKKLTEHLYDSNKQIIRTILAPHKEFGALKGTDKFNLFLQTKYLAVLNNPEPYKNNYSVPTTTIKYLESLMPNKFIRDYILGFFKYKFLNFKYSPVIPYFIGSPGSGKDTFLNIISTIIGEEYVQKPDVSVFLEKQNGWLVNQFIVHLDEYGKQATNYQDREKILAKLKSYTGKQTIQIRDMGQTARSEYFSSLTFVLTDNKNPLPIEFDDRRIAYIPTPNILRHQDWVLEMGGVSNVYNKIMSEVLDFCYYLSTEVKILNHNDYVTPPSTEDKDNLILSSSSPLKQIAYFIKQCKFEALEKMASDYEVRNFTVSWDKGRILHEKILDLYLAMTEGNGTPNRLTTALKQEGFEKIRTTTTGNTPIYYYRVDKLFEYSKKPKFKAIK